MRTPSAYEQWIDAQGVPILRGHGVTDVREVGLGNWSFRGGPGAIIKLDGMQGLTAMHLVEVPPGGALAPIRHLFEKIVFVLEGAVEVRLEGGDHVGVFDAQTLFGVPLNARHVIRNRSESSAARLLCFTNAPMIMDLFRDSEFVFSSAHHFAGRYPADRAYFEPGEREIHMPENIWLWDTTVVADAPNTTVDAEEKKGKGVRLTQCEMGGVLVTHLADWPVASYHKAHWHGGGAVLLILRGTGYTLMWPRELGTQPYSSGHGDDVVCVDWQVGSVVSPPDGWFHQHFNVSDEPARQLAFRYGSRRNGVEFHDVRKAGGVYKSLKEGGTIIEYEDEDPEIGRLFAQRRSQELSA